MSFDDDDYVDASEILGGVKILPLDEKAIVVEALMMLKIIDAEGDISYIVRSTPNLNQMERMGMCHSMVEIYDRDVADSFLYYGEDEDD